MCYFCSVAQSFTTDTQVTVAEGKSSSLGQRCYCYDSVCHCDLCCCSAAQLCKRLKSDMVSIVPPLLSPISVYSTRGSCPCMQGQHGSICCFSMGASPIWQDRVCQPGLQSRTCQQRKSNDWRSPAKQLQKGPMTASTTLKHINCCSPVFKGSWVSAMHMTSSSILRHCTQLTPKAGVVADFHG